MLGLACALVAAYLCRVPLQLIWQSLAAARVARAGREELAASAQVAAADADRRAVRERAVALAAAERSLAAELVALHLEAATVALPADALGRGSRLQSAEVELELPRWIDEEDA